MTSELLRYLAYSTVLLIVIGMVGFFVFSKKSDNKKNIISSLFALILLPLIIGIYQVEVQKLTVDETNEQNDNFIREQLYDALTFLNTDIIYLVEKKEAYGQARELVNIRMRELYDIEEKRISSILLKKHLKEIKTMYSNIGKMLANPEYLTQRQLLLYHFKSFTENSKTMMQNLQAMR